MNPEVFANLRNSLAKLYPDEPSIRRIIDDSGIDLSRVVLNSTTANNWHNILAEVEKIDQISGLLNAVKHEYGSNKEFQKAYDNYRQLEPASAQILQIFDIFEEDPLRAVQTMAYIAQVFGQDRRTLEINSQLILQVLIRRTQEWIKKMEQNPEQSLAVLVGSSLKAIAAISVENGFQEGEKFIDDQAKAFRNTSNPSLRIIKQSIAKALEFIKTRKVDYRSIA